DLGERLASAAHRVLGGKHPALFVGTDCPALDAGRMREAAESLREHDAVLIPATDGGYVLLGMRRFEEHVFQGIAWSTSAVARQTLDKFEKLGWRCESRAPLPDIDEPENLELLPAEWCEVRCG
ncbi:MAG: TIGR04282 family arsenosugar biosynthesis glycosyltransferase, partial [Steroidobacteraceae bacterium]